MSARINALHCHQSTLAYVCQDQVHNRLVPRIIDIAYTAFTVAKAPNEEDGKASDWFNDTRPKVLQAISLIINELEKEGTLCLDKKPALVEVPYEMLEKVRDVLNLWGQAGLASQLMSAVRVPDYKEVGTVDGQTSGTSGVVPTVLWNHLPTSGLVECPIPAGVKLYVPRGEAG